MTDIRNADKLKTKVAPAIKKSTKAKEIIDPKHFEDIYVHQVYQQIAPHFSDTRNVAWPLINKFIQGIPAGYSLLDCGCGNGKYLRVSCHLNAIGLDYSSNLCEIAQDRCQADLINGDGIQLPFSNNMFDAVVSIAVIHHFAAVSRRQHCIGEIYRVLKPGGKALICVWAKEQEGVKDEDLFIPWSQERDNVKHFNESQQIIDGNSVKKTINGQDYVIHQRYYHMFEFGELSSLCRVAGFDINEEEGLTLYNQIYEQKDAAPEYFDHDNWYVLLTKPL